MAKQRAPKITRPIEAAAEEIWRLRVTAPPRTVAIFTRQLATMLANGVTIISSLETLAHQPECPDFGEVLRCVLDKVRSGVTLSHSVNQFPRVFPKIYVTMVAIGEQTGALDDSLDRVATWLERDDQVRQKVRSALTYPVLVLFLAGVLTIVMFYFVLPGFVSIFRDLNIRLPLVTRIVVALTDAVRNPGAWVLFVAGTLLGVSLLRDAVRDPVRFSALFRMALRVPLIGDMLRTGSLARYSASTATMLSSGLEISKAFKMAAHASGNPLLADDSENVVSALLEGQQASDHMLTRPGLYPPGLVQMVIAGEQSSRLPDMFERCAAYYESETMYLVDSLSAALEPILLMGVASVVGTIILSIFLPMYSYLGQLGP